MSNNKKEKKGIRGLNVNARCIIENCKEPKALKTNLCIYHIAKRNYMVLNKLADYDEYLKKEKVKFTGKGQRGLIIK